MLAAICQLNPGRHDEIIPKAADYMARDGAATLNTCYSCCTTCCAELLRSQLAAAAGEFPMHSEKQTGQTSKRLKAVLARRGRHLSGKVGDVGEFAGEDGERVPGRAHDKHDGLAADRYLQGGTFAGGVKRGSIDDALVGAKSGLANLAMYVSLPAMTGERALGISGNKNDCLPAHVWVCARMRCRVHQLGRRSIHAACS